jgi:hypothetical protein
VNKTRRQYLVIGYLVIWLFGYLVIWLFGYLVIWSFGYLVIWLSGQSNCAYGNKNKLTRVPVLRRDVHRGRTLGSPPGPNARRAAVRARRTAVTLGRTAQWIGVCLSLSVAFTAAPRSMR